MKRETSLAKSGVIVSILLWSTIGFAGDPYVKVYYKGKNWLVQQVGIQGEFKSCALKSSPHFLDRAKHPRYGMTYIEISYPSHYVTFSGENIGAYFRVAKQVTLQVGHDAPISITPETPVKDKRVVDRMLSGKAKDVRVVIDFGDGQPSTHIFPLSGFREAHQELKKCAA
jgi:hypothetical protein